MPQRHLWASLCPLDKATISWLMLSLLFFLMAAKEIFLRKWVCFSCFSMFIYTIQLWHLASFSNIISLIYSYCVPLWLVYLRCYLISCFMKVSQFLWSSYNFWSQSLIEMGLAFAWGCWWPVLHLTVALATQVKINRFSNVFLGHRSLGHARQLKCFPKY